MLARYISTILLKDLWHEVHASNIDVGRGVLQRPTLLLLKFIISLGFCVHKTNAQDIVISIILYTHQVHPLIAFSVVAKMISMTDFSACSTFEIYLSLYGQTFVSADHSSMHLDFVYKKKIALFGTFEGSALGCFRARKTFVFLDGSFSLPLIFCHGKMVRCFYIFI